jgi:hypothetical protein
MLTNVRGRVQELGAMRPGQAPLRRVRRASPPAGERGRGQGGLCRGVYVYTHLPLRRLSAISFHGALLTARQSSTWFTAQPPALLPSCGPSSSKSSLKMILTTMPACHERVLRFKTRVCGVGILSDRRQCVELGLPWHVSLYNLSVVGDPRIEARSFP